MTTKRPTYTVYCETCQRHLATYVLGRGYEKYGRVKAQQVAQWHRADHIGHVVNVAAKESV